jgi:hypothetical protein
MLAIHPSGRLRTATWLLTASGIWLLGLGIYFIALRPALLPEDPRYMGATLAQLRQAAPGMEAGCAWSSPSWAAT